MANNQHVNKVEFGNQVLMDISDTTANASDVLSGKKFYSASGAPVTGTLVPGTITEVQANGTSVATSGIANIPAASTSSYGVTKLNNTTSSTSISEAATAAVVKQLNDKIGNVGSTDLQSQVTLLNDNFMLDGIFLDNLFDVVDSSLAEFHSTDNFFYKIGRTVFGSIRIYLKQATSGSTKLFTPKSSALKAKWYPIQNSNYIVFPAFTTWDANQKALMFINDNWDLGIGAANAGQYIASFTYLSRT